ncbi:MAG: competence protein ComEC [Bermanella sp.]|jgi:competence protein ComEC
MVDAALLPVLKHRKIEYLDKLIISHVDSDHAGTYQRLLKESPPERFLSSATLRGAEPCLAGQAWQWDVVSFAIITPPAGSEGSSNNRSCVLLVESGGGRALFPSDIESAIEQQLLPTLRPNISVLLARHHGSRTSSSPAFMLRLSPEFVIFSAGYKHRYGHPVPEVKRRYRQHGAELAETAKSGMITVALGPQGIKNIEHFRKKYHFYWDSVGE